MKKSTRFYLTLAEASQATIELRVATAAQYRRRYKENPRLPANPEIVYKAEWQTWFYFLGQPNGQFYKALSEASQAAIEMGITTSVQYKKRYKENSRLPANPKNVYTADWQGWLYFLGQPNGQFYKTLAEASQASIKLGITSSTQYKRRYKENPRLPACPDIVYKADWHSWFFFLGKPKVRFCKTLAEASKAAIELGIITADQYKRRCKENPILPACPNIVYKAEWQGWLYFLGKPNRQFYKTFAEASQAAIKLGIATAGQYQRRYKENPRLPAAPNEVYKADWQSWLSFLGKPNRQFYKTFAEASQAAIKLGIATSGQYERRYKENPRLPAAPNEVYKADWQSWLYFLGQPNVQFYKTLAEASQATIELGITSSTQYKSRYKEDPRLPAHPKSVYKADWQSWFLFLGQPNDQFYQTLAEASQAAIELGITNYTEYQKRYKKNPRLPSRPHSVYRSEWQGRTHFLGTSKELLYPTLAEASRAAITLGITSCTEFSRRYREDSRLPSSPDVFYAEYWHSWTHFCLPQKIDTLIDVKQASKVLQIKDSQQYREARKKYNLLPAHPERLNGWVDWYNLLDIPVPYEYPELVTLVRNAGCNNLHDYKKFRSESNDPKIPASPIAFYEKSGWTNSYDFFGKPRPYQTKYLDESLQPWATCITEFLKQARGSTTKQQELCEFVRDYIQAEGLDNSPYDFLTRSKVPVKPLLDLLNRLPVHKKKRQLYSINEFLDWIIKTELTIEDEHSGEILRLKNAANPFKHLNFDNEQHIPTINETRKPSLPYQFVKTGRDWIFPADSALKSISYGDLPHLHRFSADWIQITDPTQLDYNDPDCIIKTEQGKVYLWNPIFWTYTYALMQLPARGAQIIYCDSGEMDEEIPDFKDGNLIWLKNPSKRAGLTKRQGMIYKTENGDFGVHYTSNKTQLFGEGFDIPYMPIELAYWLIKLRKWQQKYNSIDKPTAWLECKHTNLNEIQRQYKGANCFLFRDMYDVEPSTFQGRLADRLAATLFFSVKDEAVFATYRGGSFKDVGKELEKEPSLTVSKFSSDFTPHSMRVSLINAYAFEFGLPIEVIVKLVGHASMVMTLYYVKSGLVRQKVELGEKQAFKNAQEKAQQFLDTHGIEEFKTQLTANNPEFLKSLNNKNPSIAYLWKDFGICPVGGNSCSSGGDLVIVGANLYNPVPAGYIGEQNCPRCRFFITGPAFMAGLAALYNEITLALNTQSLKHSELENELLNVASKIEVISHHHYEQLKTGKVNSKATADREALQAQRRKLNSEIETRAKKMDTYLTDLNFLFRHIQNSRSITKNLEPTETNKLMLVVPEHLDFDIRLEESPQIRLLSEVCENAELFHSCSNELALAKRSQALDKMMVNNGMKPQLMLLDEREQLITGNQLTQLMYARIQSWETIDRLIDGDLSLKDLDSEAHLTANDFKKVFSRTKPIGIGEIK